MSNSLQPESSSDRDTLSVREALDRVGLPMFPMQWTGKEYLDHWRLGLSRWPTTKLRGMQAAKELLRLVQAREAIVELELDDGRLLSPPFEVRHFHGAWSMCAGDDEIYMRCRIRFVSPKMRDAPPAGRKGFDYPKAVTRILAYLDQNGAAETADRITHTIRRQYEQEGLDVPSYSRLQPFVSELLRNRGQPKDSFPDRFPGTVACSGRQKRR